MPKIIKKLSEAQVRNALPKEKPYRGSTICRPMFFWQNFLSLHQVPKKVRGGTIPQGPD